MAALLAAAPSVQAAFPGDNGTIVFEAMTENGIQLFTMRPDGTDIRQITNVEPTSDANKPGAARPDLSPDGRTIVFLENDCQIALIDADGGNLREVPRESGVCEIDPTFGADGKSLIYGRGSPSTGDETWTMNLDGTDRRLVSDACPLSGVASPDGTRLACLDFDNRLWVMNMDGTEAVDVLPGIPLAPRYDWSPDGSALAISTIRPPREDGANVAWFAPDGSARLDFLTDYDPELGALAMSYSPDGTSILFRLTQDDPDIDPAEFKHALVLAATDGSGVEQLTDFSVTLPGLDGVAFETGHFPHFDWGPAPTE
jgi:Tol biopolymer transport system component